MKINAISPCVVCLLSGLQTTFAAMNANTEIWTTAKDTELRLTPSKLGVVEDYRQPVESEQFVFVDPNHTYQKMVGIGGAITDASAEVYAKLPKEQQQKLLEAYFDAENGIAYSILRTSIHSCDFSPFSYTYVEENDEDLSSFSIAHDLDYRVPMIQAAMQLRGMDIPLFISPWSPPAWMKDSGDMLHGGKLLPKYRQTWADYMVKTITAYEEAGVPVWGLSVQNEPMAVQVWESCIYTAEDERDFVRDHLGPALWHEGYEDRKLIVWDHNRDLIFQRASTILNDAEAAKYVWGVGFHWYETWTGTEMNFPNLQLTKEAFPDKELIFTEGCAESFDPDRTENWGLGEHYGASMIQDFNCGTAAWTDWNILLDQQGGPNHVGNFCFAPVHANTDTGELIFTNSYYYIGHFSKFVQPGALRIAASSSRTNLLSTAFLNPDDSIAVIVMNETDETLAYSLMLSGKQSVIEALPHSIQTIVIR